MTMAEQGRRLRDRERLSWDERLRLKLIAQELRARRELKLLENRGRMKKGAA